MYSFGLGCGCGIISNLWDWKYDWHKQFHKRLFWGIFTTIIYVVVVVLLIDYFIIVKVQKVSVSLFFKEKYLWVHLFYIILSLGIASFFHAKGFMLELKRSVNIQNQLEKENIASQYEALKNQTDPHFFFNSLNVLSSLVDENPKMAQKFIGKLSQIYRYILDQKDRELVNLEEELSFAEKYIFLQKIRFEEGVNYSTNIGFGQMKTLTIPLALQILLENIFKHNVVSDENPVFIKIYTEEDYLVVSNNINKKKIYQASHKLGLENIKARYTHFSEKAVLLENTQNQFVVKLPLIPKL
ncbi:MAG: sensor histidine kinase [Marinifilaceae bacterium]